VMLGQRVHFTNRQIGLALAFVVGIFGVVAASPAHAEGWRVGVYSGQWADTRGGSQPSFLISLFETVMEGRTQQWHHGVRAP